MMNAKKELLTLANGEEIEAICIGAKGWACSPQAPTFYPKHMVKEALKVLDFDFDSGFGGEEGYSLYAWTKTKVIFKSTYDGAESYEAIPRNPQNVMPQSYGGG